MKGVGIDEDALIIIATSEPLKERIKIKENILWFMVEICLII